MPAPPVDVGSIIVMHGRVRRNNRELGIDGILTFGTIAGMARTFIFVSALSTDKVVKLLVSPPVTACAPSEMELAPALTPWVTYSSDGSSTWSR